MRGEFADLVGEVEVFEYVDSLVMRSVVVKIAE